MICLTGSCFPGLKVTVTDPGQAVCFCWGVHTSWRIWICPNGHADIDVASCPGCNFPKDMRMFNIKLKMLGITAYVNEMTCHGELTGPFRSRSHKVKMKIEFASFLDNAYRRKHMMYDQGMCLTSSWFPGLKVKVVGLGQTVCSFWGVHTSYVFQWFPLMHRRI